MTDSLKSMESDGIIERIDYKENPPHVEYKLSMLGMALCPIIKSMEEFGEFYKNTI